MPEIATGILRSDVEFIRGEKPMLFDRQADAYYRISPGMLEIAAHLTESMLLNDFIARLDRCGIPASREEVLSLLAFLQQNNLLAPEYGQIGVKRERHAEEKRKSAFLRFSAAYLFFRLPPWRPERFFEKIAPYVNWLASKRFLFAAAIPALLGYVLMLRDFGAVKTTFIDSLSWAGLAKYFAAILFLKIIHEAAHSLAAIRLGCRVRGIGIGFMVFYPRLYTDTTDSWRLSRRKRLLIDAAGIISELLIGGAAALLWTYLPNGAWRSTMFYVFAVSTLSTLLVNGNPCIRYDGYYILCDLTGIDNLMTRSGEYMKSCWRKYCLGLGSVPYERHGAFLLFFGVISFAYRLFLYTSIILIIYHKFAKLPAVIMLILELYSILIYPFWREVKTIHELSKRSGLRARGYFIVFLLFLGMAVMFLPLSWSITLPGEVVFEKKQPVTVREGGYLTMDPPFGAVAVGSGETILRLESPLLDTAVERLKRMLDNDEEVLNQQRLDEKQFAGTRITQEKIRSDRLALAEMERRREDLVYRAEESGIFIPLLQDRRAGAYLAKGMKAGELASGKIIVVAYASERDVGKLSVGDEAAVRAGDSLRSFAAKVTVIDDLAVALRDSPLLQHFGGSIPVYLEAGSGDRYVSLTALYRIELAFDAMPEFSPGRAVAVKISYSERLFTNVFRLLLSAFRREF